MVWRLRLPSGRVAGSELYMLFAVSREPPTRNGCRRLPERGVACASAVGLNCTRCFTVSRKPPTHCEPLAWSLCRVVNRLFAGPLDRAGVGIRVEHHTGPARKLPAEDPVVAQFRLPQRTAQWVAVHIRPGIGC